MCLRRKIFFVHSGNESFVSLDRELLQANFEVRDFYAAPKFPAKFLQYWRGVKEAEAIYCWFASWNSLWTLILAKMFLKPSILVIGGYDVANLAEANYGNQRGGLKKVFSRWSMNLADILLPFSNYSLKEAEKNGGIPLERMKMVYIGVPDPYGALPQTPREGMALTVGNVDFANLKRKGLEPFVRAARHLPDVQFVLIGAWVDDSIKYLRSIASTNVVFTGKVRDEVLQAFYERASIYVQASLHEGFGLSVAEAMLAGCIPVVTRIGSLPEVVGPDGIYLDDIRPDLLADAISTSMQLDINDRQRARERILTNFPLSLRGERLSCLISSLLCANNKIGPI